MNGTAFLSRQAEIAFPWWVVLIEGITLVVIGGLLVTNTLVTTVLLVTFIGWWWLVSGIFELGSLLTDRSAWGWRVFSGLLSIVAGAYIISAPLLGAAVVVGFATILLGINGIVLGGTQIIQAFQGAGWGRGILGAFNLVFGAVIAANWTSLAVALPWIWGLFALLSGIVAIAGSFAIKKVTASA
jgi:uncharacterized membrane protein HdeD (DUF308 family)